MIKQAVEGIWICRELHQTFGSLRGSVGESLGNKLEIARFKTALAASGNGAYHSKWSWQLDEAALTRIQPGTNRQSKLWNSILAQPVPDLDGL